MYIAMEKGASLEQIETVEEEVRQAGLVPYRNIGAEVVVITCIGMVDADKGSLVRHFQTLSGVAQAALISAPWKLAGKKSPTHTHEIPVNGVRVGGRRLLIIAGPCSVESRGQIMETAQFLKSCGVHALRGGAFKPRTSPHGFQGLGERALEWLAEANAATGLPIVTEAMCESEVDLVGRYAQVVQIGARNMQNYRLLSKVGESGTTCLLKRGPSATLDEMLLASEYMLVAGNYNVMLCLRGIRGFGAEPKHTRNLADIGDIPALEHLTYLPVIYDPSHAAGFARLVPRTALAAVGAGAKGLIIEVHPTPAKARTDADQQLNFKEFEALMERIRSVAEADGRTL